MKKIFSILLILMVVMSLVACEENETQSTNEKQIINEMSENYIYTWTDSETGVQYIIVYRASSWGVGVDITPRLNADGTLYTVGADMRGDPNDHS